MKQNGMMLYNPPAHVRRNISDAKRRIKSSFCVFTGSAGSGKTLSMVTYILLWWQKTGLPVYSNMRVKWNDFETQNLELLDISNQDLKNCLIAIDELQNWADRQNWQSTKNRLFSYALMQKRKQQAVIYSTIQDFSWLSPRVQYQVDSLAFCTDLSQRNQSNDDLPDWMKSPGIFIGLRLRDLSGHILEPYIQTKQEFNQVLGPLWPIWDCYDTFLEQDIYEPWRRVKLEMGSTVLRSKSLPDPDVNSVPDSVFQQSASVGIGDPVTMQAIGSLADRYRDQGIDRVNCEDFRQACVQAGLDLTSRQVGQALARLGIKRIAGRPHNSYDLSGVS